MCRSWPTRSRRSRYAAPLAPSRHRCVLSASLRPSLIPAADVCLFWPCHVSVWQQEIDQVAKAMVDLEARRRNLGPQRDHVNDSVQQAK